MFLLDNLLAAPGKAMLFLFEEMAKKAQEEWLDDGSVKNELQELYSLLDAGKVGEKEFDEREQRLLARLEEIANIKLGIGSSDVSHNPEFFDPGKTIEYQPGVSPGSAALIVQEPSPASDVNDGVSRSSGVSILEALRPFIESGLANPERKSPSSRTPNNQAIVEYGASIRPLFEDFVLLLEDPAHPASRSMLEAPTIEVEQQSNQPQVPQSAPAASRHQPPAGASSQVQSSTSADPRRDASTVEPSTHSDSPRSAAVPMSEVVDNAIRTLSMTKLRVSSVISVARTSEGWKVAIELVERASVPDTSDLLGIYEVKLDNCGVVMGYERIRVRRRNDLRA